PWVESRFLEIALKHYLGLNFETLSGQYDIFNGFIEIGRSVLSERGFFGMIVPNRFCANPDYQTLREYILKNYGYLSVRDYGDGVFLQVNMPSCVLIGEPSDSRNIVHVVNLAGLSFDLDKIDIIKQPKAIIRIDTTPSLEILIKKCQNQSLLLKAFYSNARGVEIGKDSHLISDFSVPDSVRFGVGKNLSRYSFEPHFYLKLGDSTTDYKDLSLYEGSKILVRKTGHGINSSLDLSGVFVIQVIYIFKQKRRIMSDFYTLSLLNSKLLYHIYYALFGERKKKTFPHIRQEQFLQLPIRRIYFTTPKEEQEKLAEEGKEFYGKYFKDGNCDSLLSFVGQRLEKQYIPDPELVKKHNADPLNKDFQIREGELIEQSDVVHDFLAFLAEKMIEYNKEKNEETKSFLGWLEREVGTKVEDLTGKTTIKKYHETTGGNLISILKKNKKKLQIDPSRRDLQDKLSAEFDKSLQKLIPLKRKIEITDHLIDQIVYKLYGLTEEERRTVERS
ncbi:hypothetical protein HQ584_08925, partial [Patescibacteria group bacterium]|nr:hypothetical protein [Patescibacteria group bacterium]